MAGQCTSVAPYDCAAKQWCVSLCLFLQGASGSVIILGMETHSGGPEITRTPRQGNNVID